MSLDLDAIHLPCEDPEKMTSFYTDVIGLSVRNGELLPFPFDEDHENWIELDSGSAALVLKRRGAYDGDPRDALAAGVHVAFRVDSAAEVDAAYDQLRERGFDQFLSPPRDWPWQERAFFLKDPEGNLVEVYVAKS